MWKGGCLIKIRHVILLAKLHDMYLYKTDNFFHINHYLRSVWKVALLHRFYYRCMCIDIVEIWFDIANGQILSIFDRIICLPHNSGRVLSFFMFYFHLLQGNMGVFLKRLNQTESPIFVTLCVLYF